MPEIWDPTIPEAAVKSGTDYLLIGNQTDGARKTKAGAAGGVATLDANGMLNELPELDTIAALRAASGIGAKRVFVRGHSSNGDGGEGTFYQDPADTTSNDNGGTIIVDADGKRWKRIIHDAVMPTWFGAVGDGATDDTAAVSAAIDAASKMGVWVDGAGRTYRLTMTIQKNIGNVRIRNAKFDIADIAGGSAQITVADSAMFAPGDFIIVESDAIFDSNVGATYGLLTRILDIDYSTHTITVESPLALDMLVTDNATVVKVDMLDGIQLYNVHFLGNYSTTVAQTAVEFYLCRGVRVNSCRAEGVSSAGIRSRTCIDVVVVGNAISDSMYPGTAYGVSVVDASKNVVVSNNTFSNLRHGVTIGGVNGVNALCCNQCCICWQHCRDVNSSIRGP